MNAQAEKYFAPVSALNALTLENAEKLLELQIQSVNDTARLGFDQLKSAADIRDIDGLKKYFSGQAEVAQTLGERLVRDGQTAVELGISYTDKVQQIVVETFKQETPVATTAPKTAAKSK